MRKETETKTVETFYAFDDTPFTTQEACEKYEAENFAKRLVGLTEEEVQAALTRTDPDLAEAFEKAGNTIGKLRREAGEFKRNVKPKETDATAKTEHPPVVEEVAFEPEEAHETHHVDHGRHHDEYEDEAA